MINLIAACFSFALAVHLAMQQFYIQALLNLAAAGFNLWIATEIHKVWD